MTLFLIPNSVILSDKHCTLRRRRNTAVDRMSHLIYLPAPLSNDFHSFSGRIVPPNTSSFASSPVLYFLRLHSNVLLSSPSLQRFTSGPRFSSRCGNGQRLMTVSRHLEGLFGDENVRKSAKIHFLFKVSSSTQAAVLFCFHLRGMTSAKTGLLAA